MKVVHSGWTQEYGSFRYEILFDENKTDYEIRFKNGVIGKQRGAFHVVTKDWNCDGDVYPQFGAWFDYFDKNGVRTGGGFWTPQDLVFALVEAQKKTEAQLSGGDIVAVSGIKLPPRDKRPSLKEQIARTERQQMAQDIERNRKMNALGIRGPGEPWAR